MSGRQSLPGEWPGKLSRLVVFHTRTRPFSLALAGSGRKMEPPTAHYDALNLPTASVQRGEDITHLLVIRQNDSRARTRGSGKKGGKKRLGRRPLQPQVQVESSVSRPPGTRLDQVAYVARP